MSRYIDAVELVKAIEENQRNTEHHKDGHSKLIHVNEHRHFIKMVHEQPTADVAPRAEVDLYKKLNNELEDELASTYDKLENAKAEVAREIFEEIRDLIRFTMEPNSTILYAKIEFEKLKELKNKYTDATDANVGRK